MFNTVWKNLFKYIILVTCIYSSQVVANEDTTRSITLVLQKATLKTAIQSISEQSGISIVYSEELLKGKVVNCNFKDTPLEKVLQELLRKNGLKAVKSSPGIFVLKALSKGEGTAVSGYVLDAVSGAALPNANIAVSGTLNGTFSDARGRFQLNNLADGRQALKVDYIGYRPRVVAIPDQRTDAPLHIVLQSEAIPLAEVNANSGSKNYLDIARMPGKVALSLDQLAVLPGNGEQDIFDALTILPGVTNSNDGNTQFYFRGGTPSQNKITLDGVPVYRSGRALGAMSIFSADIIRDMTVYKGGHPAKYGDALSGVVALETVSGDTQKLHLSANTTAVGSQGMLQIPLAGKGALVVSGRRSLTQHYIGDLYDNARSATFSAIDYTRQRYFLNALDFGNETELSFYDLFGKLTLLPGKKNTLSFSAFRSRDFSDDIGRFSNFQITEPDDPEPFDLNRINNRGQNTTENTLASGRFSRQWNADALSSFQVSYSHYDNKFYSERERDLREGFSRRMSYNFADFKELLFKADHTWQAGNKLQLDAGGSYSRKMLQNGLAIQMINGLFYPDWEPSERMNLVSILAQELHQEEIFFDGDLIERFNEAHDPVKTEDVALYVEGLWQPLPGAEIKLGLRGVRFKEDLNQAVFQYLEPRISASYQLGRGFSLKGFWGEYHQFLDRVSGDVWDWVPFYNEQWVLAEDNRYQPGFSRHAIAGLQYESKSLLFDLEVYRKKMRGLREYSYSWNFYGEIMPAFSDGELYAQLLAGDGISRGVDMLLQKKGGLLNGWISYAYNETKIRTSEQTLLNPRELPHQLAVVGNLTPGKWHFSAAWHYASGRPAREIYFDADFVTVWRFSYLNNGRLPDTHRMDVSISRTLPLGAFDARAGLSIYNVYDQENVLYRKPMITSYYDPESLPTVLYEVKGLGITPNFFLQVRL